MRRTCRLALGALSVGVAVWTSGACSSQGTPVTTTGRGGSSGGPTGSAGSGGGAGSGGSAGASGAGGRATSSGAAGSIIPLDASGGTGGNGVDPDATCGESAEQTTPIITDVFIMEDKSGSMQCPANDDACDTPPTPTRPPTRWDAFTGAMNTFVSSPASAGVAVGIGFFPLVKGFQTNCAVADYAKPAVPIAPLPLNAKAITDAIAASSPGNGTPTLPALTGAIEYAKTYVTGTPGHSAAVLLVSDGNPNECNSTVEATAQVAQAGFTGTPSIKTYVVGLGNTAGLDQIALAGTGGATHYFPATGDVGQQLIAVLKAITGSISCKYSIPNKPDRPVDPRLVNVETVVGSLTINVGKVDALAACTGIGGWYYDDNTTPKEIVLCPASCDALKSAEGARVQILYGCPWRPPGIQ